jgi:hypothetical protein
VNRPQTRWLLGVVGVLLWVIAVLPAYYVVHKPLTGEPAFAPLALALNLQNVLLAVLGLFADLALLVLTLAVTAAWGSRIGRRLGVVFESGLEQWALGAVLGLGLLGTAVFGLAVVGGLHRWLGYVVLLILGLAALSEIRALGQWLISGLRRLRPTGIPWLWLYTGLIGLLSLGLALLPPTSWDALVYHLQGPRLYLEAHRLIAVPENFYLNWPAQVEMLFTWGMLLKGDTLAKLFHWIFWPLTAALLYILSRRAVTPHAGRWAVALWASVPFAAELAGVAYVDLALTAFVLAGVYAFFRWTDSLRDGWLALSGLFIGLAMASKYTAATWLILLGLLLIYHAWRHHRQPMVWIVARTTGFAVVAGLVLTPWLVKNWLVTGNPIYPFVFGGVGWNSTREAWLTWPGHGYSRNPLDYLALPWLATVLGTSGTPAFDATIGPLLLCLVPLIFLFRRRPRAVNYGLALAGGQLAYLAITMYRYIYLAETRLILPAFALLCVAAAFALYRLPALDRRSFRLSWVVGVVVTLVLIVNLVAEARAFLAVRPVAPLLGVESHRDYLARRLGSYSDAMRHINDRLPAQARLLFLWEPRGYYCQRPTRADATLDNLAQLRVAHGKTEDALAALQADGFTHLLLHRAGLEFIQEPTPRPPTLSSLLGQPPPEESLYPLTLDDLRFLDDLLAHCQIVGNVGTFYEIYQLP